jgi:predicted lipid-binding transport protein (Tim44 family)
MSPVSEFMGYFLDFCARIWSWKERASRHLGVAGPVLVVAALTVVLAVGLLVPEDAEARLGGGQGFSSGRRSSGSSRSSGGSSGGGGDGGADLIFLLIWLLIEQPAIGVPVVLIVITIVVFRVLMGGSRGRKVTRTHHFDGAEDVLSALGRQLRDGPAATPGLAALKAADVGFSLPVFLDYAQLLHRRATEAAVQGTWEPLAPFVSVLARQQLEASMSGVDDVREVVAGGVQLTKIERDGERFVVRVVIQNSRRETREHRTSYVYLEEQWTLARLASATSKPPEDVARMGCPSCGSAIDTDRQGRCRVCETPIVEGLLQWRAETVVVPQRRRVEPPAVGFTSGGTEPGVHQPTVLDPDLGAQYRAFRGRHPGFTPEEFQRRVEGIYMDLQKAWSEARFETARPHVTDTLYQTLRFHLEQYAEHGLRNELRDVKLLRQEIVKVQMDAWYEAITVRVYGSMKDTMVDRTGKVVGGNTTTDRIFSEYWTFLRALGSGDTVHDTRSCPSCGAALDRVSQAGVCGYCDSKITTGRFDWVLSRIDQAEVYRG